MAKVDPKYRFTSIPVSMIYILDCSQLKVFSYLYENYCRVNFYHNYGKNLKDITVDLERISFYTRMTVEDIVAVIEELDKWKFITVEIAKDKITYSINTTKLESINNYHLNDFVSYFENGGQRVSIDEEEVDNSKTSRISTEILTKMIQINIEKNDDYDICKDDLFLELASRNAELASELIDKFNNKLCPKQLPRSETIREIISKTI